jgi:2-keto-3-deoxy-L-fuconate dehydrogenase
MRRENVMTVTLAGKTAFVTAAGQGIGRATVLAFAAAGARVIATDVDESKLRGIASDAIRIAKLDMLHEADIARAASDAGAIDILFNCAGFVHQGTVLEATDDEWTFAFELNCRSMFRTMRAFLPGMLDRGHGVILNVASVASSLKGVPSRFIYSATKAAVIGMTRSVAADYVTRAIRANCLCPGTVQTPSLDERIAVNAGSGGFNRRGTGGVRGAPADGAFGLAGGNRRAGCLFGLGCGTVHHWPGDRDRWRADTLDLGNDHEIAAIWPGWGRETRDAG